MLVKNVCWRKSCMLVKTKIFQEHTFHQHTEKFSPTYFTNIHLNFCSKCSPTYRKFFANILHQHTFYFLFKIFTNIQFFSPTYRKLFANILYKYTYIFLSSPTYRKFFTNILFYTNIFHQHHYSHVTEKNVGEIVCWRKKICSFKIMFVGELCGWKFFCTLAKRIFVGCSNVGERCWLKIYNGEICTLVKTFTDMQLLGVIAN